MSGNGCESCHAQKCDTSQYRGSRCAVLRAMHGLGDPENQHNTKNAKGSEIQMERTKPEKKKHPRINMAFYDDNLDYVREAAYQNRMSITEYMNHLIQEDRKRNPLVKKADK